MKQWDYKVEEIRDGGDNLYSMEDDFNRLGYQGWEFCEWVVDWVPSSGSGPDKRQALFKRER